MASDYYNPAANDKYVEDGDTCYAEDLNKVNNATNAGFEMVESEVDAASAAAVENSGLSKEWAANDAGDPPSNPVGDPEGPNIDKFSATANANEAEGWVLEDYPGEDSYLLANGDPFTERGAKILAEECASDASDASDSAAAAAASAAEAAGTNTFSAGDGIAVVKTGSDPYDYEVSHDDTSPLSAGAQGNTTGVEVFESITIDDEGHIQAVATRSSAGFLPLSGGTLTGDLYAEEFYHDSGKDGGFLNLKSSYALVGFVGGAGIKFDSTAAYFIHAQFAPEYDNTAYLGVSGSKWKEVWSYAFNGSSDERIKKEIKPLKDISWLYEVTPISFKWKGEKAGDREVFGFTAQDVDEKVTECLGDELRGIVIKPENPEDTWGMSYTDLIAPLVKCVQDQKKLIDSLTERLEILEAK